MRYYANTYEGNLITFKVEYKINISINSVNWLLLIDLSHKESLIVTLMKSYIHKSRLKSIESMYKKWRHAKSEV